MIKHLTNQIKTCYNWEYKKYSLFECQSKGADEMGARGRKSGAEEWITEDGLLMLEMWAREGLTDKQIAQDKIGVCESSFCTWKKNYPVIVTALKKGKAPVDCKVENALLKRALGYEYEEVVQEVRQDENGNIIEKHIKKTTKQVIPDTTAQIFWLKNRRPDRWKDKPEIADTNALDKLDAILASVKKNVATKGGE